MQLQDAMMHHVYSLVVLMQQLVTMMLRQDAMMVHACYRVVPILLHATSM
jgi:hypothetical protein